MTTSPQGMIEEVPLELVLEAQRALLGADSVEALAIACWTLTRGLAPISRLQLYRRDADGAKLIAAIPPVEGGDDRCAALLRLPGGAATGLASDEVTVAWTPGDPQTGALVLEHAGGDEPTLAAVAAIAAGALGGLLERERDCNQERRQLARRLHDGTLQDLAYVSLRMDLLERTLASQPADLPRLAEELRADLAAASDSLRSAIGELHPQSRSSVPLERAGGQRVELERVVLGIVREALTNVRKHAGASRVLIELTRAEGDLAVTVRDNGVGIRRPSSQLDTQHFGIAQMRELAAEAGGSLAIEDDETGGTRVVARLPLGSVAWVW